MIELLRRAAAARPDWPAVITDEATTSYAELLSAATAAAAALTARGIRRFGVVDIDAFVVTALLAGASLAGIEICNYPPVEADEIGELANRLDHDVLVTDRTDLAGLAGVELLSPAELLAASDITAPAEPPAERRLLVLTTGTTGKPRAAIHDWSRVLRSAQRIEPSADERWLLAYGLHQFAGLQVLVHVFAAGATLVGPAPRRPKEGLAAMRAHGVDHASATPTYWRFVLAEMRADGGPVPALQQITLGGEAIPGRLLDDLAASFPDAKISQVYAASEFGPSGSVRDGRNGLPLDVLDRGDDADLAMKIVDGELWVRSRIGMLGYYGEPEVDADGWRATGDLVEVVDDRIYFRGRTSEIINVGGVKVHPLPVEERVAAVPGVAMARVYGRSNPLTGAVVAVDVVPLPATDTGALEAAVRSACAELPAASRPRSIRFVDEVEMTGHKVIRGTAS